MALVGKFVVGGAGLSGGGELEMVMAPSLLVADGALRAARGGRIVSGEGRGCWSGPAVPGASWSMSTSCSGEAAVDLGADKACRPLRSGDGERDLGDVRVVGDHPSDGVAGIHSYAWRISGGALGPWVVRKLHPVWLRSRSLGKAFPAKCLMVKKDGSGGSPANLPSRVRGARGMSTCKSFS